jgi:hypothetical protein
VVNGERLVFGLKEKVSRRDRQLSAAELRQRKQNPHRCWPHEYTYTPTGELTLAIRDSDVYGVPLVWRDGKRRKVEDLLNDIVFGFTRAAERKAEIREERKRRAEEEREREQIRYQKLLEIQKEEERVKRLYEDVRCWFQSEQLRSFVAARTKSFEQAGKSVDQEWVGWVWRLPGLSGSTRYSQAPRLSLMRRAGCGRKANNGPGARVNLPPDAARALRPRSLGECRVASENGSR